MTIQFAVNYSEIVATLLRTKQIQFNRFKCPAWPDLMKKAQAQHPIYVHCPLRVGWGIGEAQDTETNLPPNWTKYEALLAQTDTPWVSLHLGPKIEDFPDIPPTSLAPAHVAQVTQALLRDISAVVARFGPERVVVENIFGFYGNYLWAAMLPEVIAQIIIETGCGFLLDLSHAVLAARDLARPFREYVRALPVAHIREVHITGVQRFTGHWAALSRAAGIDVEALCYNEQLIDHMPMTAADWKGVTWAMAQIHSGAWATPWVVAVEYGGVGGIFEALGDVAIFIDQIPRLRALVKGK